MSRLNAEVVRGTALSGEARQAMYALYASYYAGSDAPMFYQDLQSKDHIILLYDRTGTLRGFSTLALLELEFQQKPLRALFSGDTVIHHAYWGEQALPLCWCRLAGQIKAQKPQIPLYWFLIVKGHRTYRYLNVFSKTFYPTWRYATPPPAQALIDFLAQTRFAKHYRADLGILHFERSHGHLREDWASISEHQLRKPDVRFFLERNPGYAHGDELVCLTELSPDNLRRYALEAFTQGLGACTPG